MAHLRRHPAWDLLRADHAALVLSFLGSVFVAKNAGAVAAVDLIDQLDDELYRHNGDAEEPPFPRSARQYLDDWTERRWLRKSYQLGTAEPHYEITPAVERALLWIGDLRPRDFVGTASRLNTVIELLRQMVYGAETDPRRRLDHLRRQRDQLDAEIDRVERGEVVLLGSADQRDRYDQFSRTSRELLADFRQVEENFRSLDRRLRERIAGWDGSKGALLDEMVADRSSITDSDQGRSFRAFYDLLLSPERRAELTELLARMESIADIPDKDPALGTVHFAWIDASERAQETVRLLSEQLRRFLDDQVWLENRRVFDLLRSIESKALTLRSTSPEVTMELDDAKVPFALPFERPLYRSTRPEPLRDTSITPGDDVLDASLLWAQVHVDRARLVRSVLDAMSVHGQVELEDVVAGAPLEHGLAELVGYFALDVEEIELIFDDDARARIAWTSDDAEREADTPRVTYVAAGDIDA